MPITYIPAIGRKQNNEFSEEIVTKIRSGSIINDSDTTIVYSGWPQVKDYNGKTHTSDLTIIGNTSGVKLINICLSSDPTDIKRSAQSILQAAATTEAQLTKSLILRKRRRLVVDVLPILFSPNSDPNFYDNDDLEFITTEAELYRLLKSSGEEISAAQQAEVQAIIEGAKALGQLTDTEEETESSQISQAYKNLEAIIYNFDATQRSVALTSIKGPQRIRGLAGTGKTVILAMKAALAHIENPNSKILITYYTRSLRDVIERLITRFHRHFAETDPNWDNVHVRHGWGRNNLPGVYRDTCIREGVSPKNFSHVRGQSNPFGIICQELVSNKDISPYYDLVLVDEGQDFPDAFYQLCFYLTKGSRDEKQIVWAYDELQNVFAVQVREPEVLFGIDDDGNPRISLSRSLPSGTETNDFVLQRSYRNQREVLVLAHAIGFGVYGETVQMLENAKHWEDVGYDIVSGDFTTGSVNIVERPERNSPSTLNSPADTPVIKLVSADDPSAEIDAAVSEISYFIENGIAHHNIMVISLDDQSTRSYFSSISNKLANIGIPVNNIIKDPYSEPPFRIDGKVTLSTVYRAKGNEAAVVIILGADAAVLKTRTGRNKLFVAFTRTKAWLRVIGSRNKNFTQLCQEVEKARSKSPRIEFTMPDMNELNTIQRGLEEKHARIIEAKRRIDRIQSELNLSNEDMSDLIEE